MRDCHDFPLRRPNLSPFDVAAPSAGQKCSRLDRQRAESRKRKGLQREAVSLFRWRSNTSGRPKTPVSRSVFSSTTQP